MELLMRRLAPRLLACACLLAGAAHADPLPGALASRPPSGGPHPFGVDDLLAHESLGEVTFSPSRRWLVTQSMGPYGSIRDWSLLAWADMTISRLDVVDLKTGGPPRRLFADAPDYGYLPGPYSPSGDQMAVTRVRGHDRELGIVDLLTGAATWTGLTPVHNYFGATMQWRSAHELIAVTQDPDTPSITPIYEWQVQARLQAAWKDAAAGRVSVTPIGSGKYLGRHAPPVLRKLVSINASTGRATLLLAGDVEDLALSPDGGKAAVLSAEEDVRPDPNQVARTNNPFRRTRLAILDLANGETWRPCPDEEINLGLMAWSPSGAGLLVQAKDEAQSWEQAVYWRIDLASRRAAPLALGSYKLAADGNRNYVGPARGHWLDEDPLVLARPVEPRTCAAGRGPASGRRSAPRRGFGSCGAGRRPTPVAGQRHPRARPGRQRPPRSAPYALAGPASGGEPAASPEPPDPGARAAGRRLHRRDHADHPDRRRR
jgi:dipeptidyl aminopeptidase/acylaminoacyl peptidase